MTFMMVAAALYGVLQLFVVTCPTRSVRLSTLLLTVAVGMYGCGLVVSLAELGYNNIIAAHTGQGLVAAVDSTSYTAGPWVEEIVKAAPLLLAGLYVKVRRQWGLTDFTVLGAALGAGFGLLEALLRYATAAGRVITPLARPGGGWIVPEGLLSSPYIPGPVQLLTAWLPAPAGTVDLSLPGPTTAGTLDHLVFTALAGLGIGILFRGVGWTRLLAAPPAAAAVALHTLNNYAASDNASQGAVQWWEWTDAHLAIVSLLPLAVAMAVDGRRIHRGKHALPDILLTAERASDDGILAAPAALFRYAARRPPWSLLILARYLRLRRTLLYATTSGVSGDTGELYGEVVLGTVQVSASGNRDAWRAVDVRAVREEARAARGPGWRRWLRLVIPCVLMLPAVLYLGAGSFISTGGLQKWFKSGPGPYILMGFAVGAFAWVAYQLIVLLRGWRAAGGQVLGESVASHRFRTAAALASAAVGALLFWQSLTGYEGPAGPAIPNTHLIEALDYLSTALGLALFLLAPLALLALPDLAILALDDVALEGVMSRVMTSSVGRRIFSSAEREALLDKVAQMESVMTEAERGRTTYAAAHVTTAGGEDEIWVAGAGKGGYARPAVRGDAFNARSPAVDELSFLKHVNDAEMHLHRYARSVNAKINHLGATRPVCGWCQTRLPSEVASTIRTEWKIFKGLK